MKVERAKAMAIGSSEIAAASAGQGFSPCMPSIGIHAARAEALCSPLFSSQRRATATTAHRELKPETQAARGRECVREREREGESECHAELGQHWAPVSPAREEQRASVLGT